MLSREEVREIERYEGKMKKLIREKMDVPKFISDIKKVIGQQKNAKSKKEAIENINKFISQWENAI